MTPLVWANFPLMFLISAAIIGVPAWMIFKRTDGPADHSEAHAYLRAKAGLQRGAAAGAGAPAQVEAMAAAVGPAVRQQGHWQLAAPRGRMTSRRPAAGRTGRSRDRNPARERSRSDA